MWFSLVTASYDIKNTDSVLLNNVSITWCKPSANQPYQIMILGMRTMNQLQWASIGPFVAMKSLIEIFNQPNKYFTFSVFIPSGVVNQIWSMKQRYIFVHLLIFILSSLFVNPLFLSSNGLSIRSTLRSGVILHLFCLIHDSQLH